jgi:predicted dehydrogenase
MPNEKSQLRIAVVGAGVIGQRHIELVEAAQRTVLAAIVDVTPEARELAERCGVPHFIDLEDLLAANIADGVILATPNHLHANGAMKCAEAGISALIEKPVVGDLSDLAEVLEVVERCGVPMLVGHHRRHGSALQKAKKIVQSGELGRLVSVMGSAQFAKPESYFLTAPWRTAAGGGPILINLIHEMDALRFLCGEIIRVQAFATHATREFEVEDTVAITMEFENGALGTFLLSDVAAIPMSWEQTSGENPQYPRSRGIDCYAISGTQGSLAVPTMRRWTYEDAPSWFTPFVEGNTERKAERKAERNAERNAERKAEHGIESETELAKTNPLVAQLEHFCDLITGAAKPLVSVADAGESLRVVEAVRRAVAMGATVVVKDVF